MGIYTFFYGSKIEAGMSAAELKVVREKSDAAFKAAIDAFSVHDNPTPTIRKRRTHFLMRFSVYMQPDDKWVMYGVRHSDRSGIVPAFRDFMIENSGRFFK